MQENNMQCWLSVGKLAISHSSYERINWHKLTVGILGKIYLTAFIGTTFTTISRNSKK